MNRIRILVADDHAVVREGLRFMLEQEFTGAHIGQAQDALEVLRLMREEGPWDMVILDIGLPGRSGLDVLKDIRYEHPQVPVLVLSMYPEEQYAVRLIKAGAHGYLAKKSAPDELVKAVHKVLEGGQYLSVAMAEKLALRLRSQKGKTEFTHETLSDREFQILCLIGSGKTVSEIAADLSLSVKTVSTHRTHILAKMDMKSNAELTRYALENHLVQ